MNTHEPTCLFKSINTEISKIVMYEFCCNYAEPKCTEKVKLCCMNTGSFMVYMKIEDIYIDPSKDVEIRFDTSN